MALVMAAALYGIPSLAESDEFAFDEWNPDGPCVDLEPEDGQGAADELIEVFCQSPVLKRKNLTGTEFYSSGN